MALDKQGYPVGFQDWWYKNVTLEQNPSIKAQHASQGRQYLAALLQKEQQAIDEKKATDEQKKAQQNQNILGLGSIIGTPLAYYGAKELFKEKAPEAAANVLANAGGLESLAGGAAAPAAPELISATRVAPALNSATPGAFDLAGIGSAGNAILPAAGLIGLGDLFLNKRKGTTGALEGAASGAAIGTYFLPGWGTAIGAGLGGLSSLVNTLGDKDRFQEEWKRKKKLFDQGLIDEAALGEKPKQGRSKAELMNPNVSADFTGYDPAGNWTNNKFTQSRNESDLRGEDIQGYAAPFELLGQDYANADLQKKIDFGNKLIEQGLVREHHGQIDYTDPNRAKQVWQSMALSSEPGFSATKPVDTTPTTLPPLTTTELAPMESNMPRTSQEEKKKTTSMFGRSSDSKRLSNLRSKK